MTDKMIAGYSYGMNAVARSPVTMEDISNS
jgi:hypothetical protein